MPDLQPQGPAAAQRRARCLQLAADALNAAIDDDWDQANKTMGTLSRELGVPGVKLAMIGWCDALITAQQLVPGTPARLVWHRTDTGEIHADADDVIPSYRWAGRLIAARAARDEPMYEALIHVLPKQQPDLGEYLGALLASVATTLTRMGAEP